jgi:hypothetical protein
MMIRRALIIMVLTVLFIPTVIGQEQTKPLILIFAPKSPMYGNDLKRLIEEDDRIDAEVQVLESSEIFRVKLYFPNVKMTIVTIQTSLNQGIESVLEWYFSQGGGLIGLGFAGAEQAVGNASQNVFPIFATSYTSGIYVPAEKKIYFTFLKEEDDPISNGLGDITIPSHKLALSFNGSSNTYLPRSPAVGTYKVLYRDENSGAPAIVKYENVGKSMTFAAFGGDDIERSPNYFGKFTSTDEFRTLFTNSVSWVWNAEEKYQASMDTAEQFFKAREDEKTDILEEASRLDKKAKNARTTRFIMTFVLTGIGVVAVYWLTFVRTPGAGKPE